MRSARSSSFLSSLSTRPPSSDSAFSSRTRVSSSTSGCSKSRYAIAASGVLPARSRVEQPSSGEQPRTFAARPHWPAQAKRNAAHQAALRLPNSAGIAPETRRKHADRSSRIPRRSLESGDGCATITARLRIQSSRPSGGHAVITNAALGRSTHAAIAAALEAKPDAACSAIISGTASGLPKVNRFDDSPLEFHRRVSGWFTLLVGFFQGKECYDALLGGLTRLELYHPDRSAEDNYAFLCSAVEALRCEIETTARPALGKQQDDALVEGLKHVFAGLVQK